MKLTDLLDQIDRLDQEATPGPWQSDGDALLGDTYKDHNATLAPFLGDIMRSNDAEFIALARTALPALAQAVQGVLDVLDGHPAPRKEADPTGYATARLELLEHHVREAIQEAIGDTDE